MLLGPETRTADIWVVVYLPTLETLIFGTSASISVAFSSIRETALFFLRPVQAA